MPTELPPHSPDVERMQAQLPREEVVPPPREEYVEMPEPGRSPTFQHVVDVSYMVVTALVLFFAPLLNGFLGGVAGGFRAGTFRRALPAAVAASFAVPAMLFLLYSFPGAGLHRFFSGLGFEGFAILNAVGLLLGAVTGVLCNPRSDVHLPRFLRFHDYEAPAALRDDMMMHPVHTVHPGAAVRREGVHREGGVGPIDRTAPRRRWLRRP